LIFFLTDKGFKEKRKKKFLCHFSGEKKILLKKIFFIIFNPFELHSKFWQKKSSSEKILFYLKNSLKKIKGELIEEKRRSKI